MKRSLVWPLENGVYISDVVGPLGKYLFPQVGLTTFLLASRGIARMPSFGVRTYMQFVIAMIFFCLHSPFVFRYLHDLHPCLWFIFLFLCIPYRWYLHWQSIEILFWFRAERYELECGIKTPISSDTSPWIDPHILEMNARPRRSSLIGGHLVHLRLTPQASTIPLGSERPQKKSSARSILSHTLLEWLTDKSRTKSRGLSPICSVTV